MFAWDKYCATHGKWRVKESTLLLWSAIGGALGAGAAMEICHHKTLHANPAVCANYFSRT
ncbi:MAG: DUF1294 domain-containing protein [Selenomonadaceae bacterium]|nr:DUF1294 domain-containing protein [Selenomonadaceae bacterium]